jgi:hypothetical protein
MPIAAAVNDLYQVRLVGRMEGQETNNVLHFRCTGADDDVLTHLILVLANCFILHVLPVLTSSWSLEKIVWKRVGPTLGPEFESVPVGAGAGGGSAAALPSLNSVVFSIRTALGGKSHRGRMYLAGIPEDQTKNSFLDTDLPFWAGMLAFAACVVGAFVPGDPPGAPSWAMGVYSRKLGGEHIPFGLAGFSTMSEFVPHALLGTTRSRKVGRGS